MSRAKTEHHAVVRPPADLNDCGEVSRRLKSILDITLEECDAKRGEVRQSPPTRVHVEVKGDATLDQETNVVTNRVEFAFHADYVDGDNIVPSVRVRAVYVIFYALTSSEELRKEHLGAFAQLQGPFNAWSFYRELLHSMSLKMGLPGLILPLNMDGLRQSDDTAPTAPEKHK